MTTMYLLLEWVGYWKPASYNEDTAPLFRTEAEAFDWVRAKNSRDPEIENVLTRFRTRPIVMPGPMFPVDDENGWTGRYEERDYNQRNGLPDGCVCPCSPCICGADEN